MNRNVSWIFGALLVLFIVGVPYEYYRYRYTTLKRLRVVDEGKLYRSGCLTVDGFEEAIREYGIRTIVNLQEESVDPELPKTYFSMQRERESELCKRLGVRYEFLKVDTLPNDREKPPTIDAFFKIMDDPKAWPVLIHCKAGLHRTGVLVALYRMEYDGYSVYEALEEMRDNGFGRNPSYSPNDYIRQYLANYVPRRNSSPRSRHVALCDDENVFKDIIVDVRETHTDSIMFGAGINADCPHVDAKAGEKIASISPPHKLPFLRSLSELSEQQKAFLDSASPPGVTVMTDRLSTVNMNPTSAAFEKKLKRKLTIDTHRTPVHEALDMLRVLLDLRFEVDPEADINQTISIAANDVTLLSVLSQMATQAKLDCIVHDGVIRFRPRLPTESRNEIQFNENFTSGQPRPHRRDEKMPPHLTPERVDGGIMP